MAKTGGRKLLVASLGVAAVSYVACGGSCGTVANLMAPPQDGSADGSPDAHRMDAVVANLMAPPDGFGAPDVTDAQTSRDGSDGQDSPTDRLLLFDVVANLVPTPR
jgi:hypothetical protein